MKTLVAAALLFLPAGAFSQHLVPSLPETPAQAWLSSSEANELEREADSQAELSPMIFQIVYAGEAEEKSFELEGFLAITESGPESDNTAEITLVAGFPESEEEGEELVHGSIAISTQPSLLGFDAEDVADPEIGEVDPQGRRIISIKKGKETLPMGGWVTSAEVEEEEVPTAHLAQDVEMVVSLEGDEAQGTLTLTDPDGKTYWAFFFGRRVF